MFIWTESKCGVVENLEPCAICAELAIFAAAVRESAVLAKAVGNADTIATGLVPGR